MNTAKLLWKLLMGATAANLFKFMIKRFTFYRQSSGLSILESCTSLVCGRALSASAPSPSSFCRVQPWLCTTSATAASPDD